MYKILLALLAVGIVLTAGLFYSRNRGGEADNVAAAGGIADNTEAGADSETVDVRISVNDFSGQWNVVRNLFTKYGLIRLGISIVGKWFYLASATGFVICWGIMGLCKNACLLCRDGVRWVCRRKRKEDPAACAGEYTISVGERLWMLGVLAAWFSTFLISAIYKEGFYKNDDLFNGRYVEFTIGFLMLYGLNCLINDKKWVRGLLLCVVLYIAAGHLCQYAIDEIGRKEFELAHCVMFGRMIWNYEVPVGKVRVVESYILPLTAAFFVVLKLARTKIPRLVVARTILALVIPIAAWSYLGKSIVDHYVVVRNEKQAEPLPQFALWIDVLGNGDEKVYYITDWANERYAGALQYMLQDQPVTVTALAQTLFTEDAFFVMKRNCMDMEAVTENCEMISSSGSYVLFINNNQKLMERWRPFTE